MSETLLSIVQDVASSTDADEINSINDNIEAQQIATIVKRVYFDLKDRADLPEHYGLVNLTPSTDNLKPTLMSVPQSVDQLLWVKYNRRTVTDTVDRWSPITFMALPDFLQMTEMYSTDEDDVGSFVHTADGFSTTFYYRNDVPPTYYTTFDDNTLVFNSYDQQVDATLQAVKTQAYAKLVIPFTMTDNFVIDLDPAQLQLLFNEAKALAWAELKQTQHQKAEQAARRGWVKLQTSQQRVKTVPFFDTLPNYGRRPRGY